MGQSQERCTLYTRFHKSALWCVVNTIFIVTVQMHWIHLAVKSCYVTYSWRTKNVTLSRFAVFCWHLFCLWNWDYAEICWENLICLGKLHFFSRQCFLLRLHQKTLHSILFLQRRWKFLYAVFVWKMQGNVSWLHYMCTIIDYEFFAGLTMAES